LPYIDKKQFNSPFCYPNPASTEITFTKEFTSVEISNMQGKVLQETMQSNSFNVSLFSNGWYIISAIDKNGFKQYQKLLIVH
jgi:hypothetical protein